MQRNHPNASAPPHRSVRRELIVGLFAVLALAAIVLFKASSAGTDEEASPATTLADHSARSDARNDHSLFDATTRSETAEARSADDESDGAPTGDATSSSAPRSASDPSQPAAPAPAPEAPGAGPQDPTPGHAPAAEPAIVAFDAPTSVPCFGPEPIDLSWNVTDGDVVELSVDGPGVYDTFTGPEGSTTVTFPCDGQPHTYTLRVVGPGGEASQTVEVVSAPPTAPVFVALVVPSDVACSGPTQVPFHWQVTLAQEVNVYRNGTFIGKNSTASLDGVLPIDCQAPTSYEFEAIGPGGTTVQSRTIVPIPAAPTLDAYDVDLGPCAPSGGKITVAFTTTGATTVDLRISGKVIGSADASTGAVTAPRPCDGVVHVLEIIVTGPGGTTGKAVPFVG